MNSEDIRKAKELSDPHDLEYLESVIEELLQGETLKEVARSFRG